MHFSHISIVKSGVALEELDNDKPFYNVILLPFDMYHLCHCLQAMLVVSKLVQHGTELNENKFFLAFKTESQFSNYV